MQTAGIRQGCPLSPLLFALAADLLLKRLRRTFPTACIRAYADDLAMVLPDFSAVLGQLETTFEEYERLAGLRLHHGKSVLVPLFAAPLERIRETMAAAAPSWGDFSISLAAKYLGIVMGPGRGEQSWEKPIRKFLDRSRAWGAMGGGMHLNIRAYQIYIATVLSFVGQLDNLPREWGQHEAQACRLLFKGPTGWMTPGCLRAAKHLGLPAELPDLRVVTLAAKCRVHRYENAKAGGLNATERAEELERVVRTSAAADIPLDWLPWLCGSFLRKLADAHEELQARDPGCERARALAGTDPAARKTQWQRACVVVLRPPHIEQALRHLRRRLDRWEVEALPGHRVGRVVQLLQSLSRLVQPRVVAAVLRLLCNGVVTARRFQGRGRCRFGCPEPDSVEHYAGCPHVVFFYRARLGLALGSLARFLLLHRADEQELARGALGVYSVIHALNHARAGGFSVFQAREALQQGLREAVRGRIFA